MDQKINYVFILLLLNAVCFSADIKKNDQQEKTQQTQIKKGKTAKTKTQYFYTGDFITAQEHFLKNGAAFPKL